jgi:hypothetical protein
MTLPTADSFDQYGGLKQDFSSVVDPTTDRSAAEVNTAFASMASASRTSIRAFLQFLGSATTPTVNFHNAHWGSTLSVLPVVTRNSIGNYTITFPSTITDPLGVVQSVNLVSGRGGLEGTVPGFVTVTKATPNTLTVLLFSAAGTASDLTTSNINIWVI